MKTSMKTRILGCILLSLMMTGCILTVDSDITHNESWDNYDVDQIEVGETTRDWVLSSFGAPHSKLKRSDGSERWRYRSISERETEIGFFLLFHFDIERQYRQTLVIGFEDDVVVEYSLNGKSFE